MKSEKQPPLDETFAKHVSLGMCVFMFGYGLFLFFPSCKPSPDYCRENEWSQVAAVWFAFPVSIYCGVVYSAFRFQWRIRWPLVFAAFLAIFGAYLTFS